MMASGKEAREWERASIIMSLLHAVARLQCAKPPKALGPEDFNPYAKKTEPLPVPVTVMRDVFCRKQKKKPKT